MIDAECECLYLAVRAAKSSCGPISWTEYHTRLEWFLTYYGRQLGLE